MDSIREFQGEHRWLSNFWPCEVSVSGITYPSSEHAFQAQKTLHLPSRQLMSKLKTPGKAKRYGKTLELRPDWDLMKLSIMEDVVYAKFMQNDSLCRKLIDTGDARLIEGNRWGDRFWGICPRPGYTEPIEGLNWLGVILMLQRSRLNYMYSPMEED